MSIEVSFRNPVNGEFIQPPTALQFFVPNYGVGVEFGDLSFTLSSYWPEEIRRIFTRHINPETGDGKMTTAQIAEAALHVKIFVEAQQKLPGGSVLRLQTLEGLRDILRYAKEQGFSAVIY